jgi:hypothetical protein
MSVDAMLNGGLISGQSIGWRGNRSCGKTGVLRAVVNNARRQGLSGAWINTGHDLVASDWDDTLSGHLWVIRPPGAHDVLFCAEIMLRTQSFGILIIDDLPKLKGNQALRLRRLARQNSTTVISIYNSERVSHTHAHVHFQFEARVEPSRDDLGRRQPFSWHLTTNSSCTASPNYTHDLRLTETSPRRLIDSPTAPDRASGQVSVDSIDHHTSSIGEVGAVRESLSEKESGAAKLILFSRNSGRYR